MKPIEIDIGEGRLRADWAGLAWIYDLAKGVWSLRSEALGVSLGGVAGGMSGELGGGLVRVSTAELGLMRVSAEDEGAAGREGRTIVLRGKTAFGFDLLQRFRFYGQAPFLETAVGVDAGGLKDPLKARLFRPAICGGEGAFKLPGPTRDWSVFNMGYQSWTTSRALPVWECNSGPAVDLVRRVSFDRDHPSQRKAGRHYCDLLAAVKGAGPEGVVFGFTTLADQLCQAVVRRSPRSSGVAFECRSHADGVEVGRELWSETLCIFPTRDPVSGVEAWADRAAALAGVKAPKRADAGWCSWYRYFTRVRERDLRENLAALEKWREELPLEIFQIDDGYQTCVGDWLDVKKSAFPSGLKTIAADIREGGMEPGLWLAPFLARKNSRLFRERPELFLKDRSGQFVNPITNPNWGGSTRALDLTHPGAIEWLRGLIREIVHGLGFRFLKLDFLYAGAADGVRHDPSLTRAQAFRRGMLAIREAAGPEARLMGCGAPLGPSLGLVDSMRIGPDVAPVWSNPAMDLALGGPFSVSAENGLRNCITRWALHQRFWINDPDCLLIRKDQTKLSAVEARTLATVVHLTGGRQFSSDDASTLTEDRLSMLKTIYPPPKMGARPADLFRRNVPSVFYRKWPNGAALAGVFNWESRQIGKNLDFESLGLDPNANYHAYDCWKGGSMGIFKGGFRLRPKPHGCVLLLLTPDEGGPSVLGADFYPSIFDWMKSKRTPSGLEVEIFFPCAKMGEMLIDAGGPASSAKLENVVGGKATLEVRSAFRAAVRFDASGPIKFFLRTFAG